MFLGRFHIRSQMENIPNWHIYMKLPPTKTEKCKNLYSASQTHLSESAMIIHLG